jgi:predicted alpha/beta superfamily hydrolase
MSKFMYAHLLFFMLKDFLNRNINQKMEYNFVSGASFGGVLTKQIKNLLRLPPPI